MKKLLLLFLLASCAHKNSPSDPSESDQVEQLRMNYDGWQKDLKAKADPNTGWFSKDCDGAVWEGEAVASGFPGQLVLAERDSGLIGRRPVADGDCYPKESGTQSSPDMRQGYLMGMWATKDLQALERVEAYGVAAKWHTGLPQDDLANLWRPDELGLLYRMLGSLGDDLGGGESQIGLACGPVFKDYEFHIQTIGILTDGEVSGGISDLCMYALKRNAEQFQSDALLQAAWGVYSGDLQHAFKLLLDPEYHCPAYVRSGESYPEATQVYCTIHKAYAARIVLKRYEK